MKTERVTLSLPIKLTVRDYHELNDIAKTINSLHPDKKVIATEVGFDCGMYIGIIHLNTPEQNQYVAEMISEYSD